MKNNKKVYLCNCGCGQQIIIKPYHKYYGIPNYLKGHYCKLNPPQNAKGKIPWNKGKTGIYSEETLQKIRIKATGRKQSLETIEKKKNKMIGRKQSETTIEKRRKTIQQLWDNMPKKRRKQRIDKAKQSLQIASKKNKGRKQSEETCKKRSISGKGKHDHNREQNPNWKNGASFLPYPSIWTKKLRQRIIKRDNNECQNPNCSGKTKILSVHHIDYFKDNCSDLNLITLCCVCNSKANHNRKFWEKTYTTIVRLKYKEEEIRVAA
jgi:hypothetical protein